MQECVSRDRVQCADYNLPRRVLSLCRSAYLVTEYSVLITIYQGVLTVYVVINFGLATFMDPGVYPKGNLSSFCVRL